MLVSTIHSRFASPDTIEVSQISGIGHTEPQSHVVASFGKAVDLPPMPPVANMANSPETEHFLDTPDREGENPLR